MIHDPDEALQHELADFPRCRLEICRPAEYVSAPARPSQGLQPIGSEPIIFPSSWGRAVSDYDSNLLLNLCTLPTL